MGIIRRVEEPVPVIPDQQQGSDIEKAFHQEMSQQIIDALAEFKDVFPQLFKTFFSEVHHMTTAISFETQPVPHLAAGIQVPHCVFGIEIGSCSIIVATLHHNMQIRILCHCLP